MFVDKQAYSTHLGCLPCCVAHVLSQTGLQQHVRCGTPWQPGCLLVSRHQLAHPALHLHNSNTRVCACHVRDANPNYVADPALHLHNSNTSTGQWVLATPILATPISCILPPRYTLWSHGKCDPAGTYLLKFQSASGLSASLYTMWQQQLHVHHVAETATFTPCG